MRRLLITSYLMLALLATGNAICASSQRYAALQAIAVSRPCLATALLFVGMAPETSGAGVLRLDGIPTLETVVVLSDTSGRVAKPQYMVTQIAPYASASYLLEIRWKASVIARGRYLFTTQARLVDSAGAPLVPEHVIEPVTTALVTPESVQLLGGPGPSKARSSHLHLPGAGVRG